MVIINIDIGSPFRVVDFSKKRVARRKALKELSPIETDNELNLVITYPLTNPFHAALLLPRHQYPIIKILEAICESYKMIYSQEEETAAEAKTLPIEDRGPCINRNTTDGVYGIWGHDIEDLWVEGLEYDDETNTVTPIMGS